MTAASHPDRFLLAGVMGFPVMHSRSPTLHNHWFAEHGLAGSYLPLAIPPERLQAALRALPALGFSGCNLTIPHKEAAVGMVDEADDAARKIGAVSCVTVREDGSLHGANYDGYGFLQSLSQEAPDWRAEAGPALIVGAGGAARSIAEALIEAGAPRIILVNRTRARAEALAEACSGWLGKGAGSRIEILDWDKRHDALSDTAILVNTTSQGMEGQPSLDLRLNKLPQATLVADIVYVPLMTPLLQAAKARGNRTVNGLGMLLHQARPAWKSWFGIETKVTPELRSLIEATL